MRRARDHSRGGSRLCRRRGGRARHVEDTPAEKLYTTPEDMVAVYEALNGLGRFMFAATFGNVHGAYKPGAVKLSRRSSRRPGRGDRQVWQGGRVRPRLPRRFRFRRSSDIRETLDYGVVKMNIDTDTQYAFTRPIVTHICENIEGVLKIDGEVGNKKIYDPRSLPEEGRAEHLPTA